MASLPLYAPIESRDGSLTKGAFLKNAFVEKVGEAMNTFRRPGLAAYSTLGTAAAGQGVTNFYSSDGSEYLFAGLGGTLYNSGARTVSTSWVDGNGADFATGGTPATIHCMSLLSYGNVLWAVGSNNVNTSAAVKRFVVYYSTDNGTSWTKLVDVLSGTAGYPVAGSWNACVHNGKMWLVGGYNAAGALIEEAWYSSNGATWTLASSNLGTALTAIPRGVVSHSDGKMYLFVYGTANCQSYSTDGVTWTAIVSTPGYNTGGTARDNQVFLSVGSYLYCVGGYAAGNTQKIYRSTDGASWAELGSNVLTMFSDSVVVLSCVYAFGALYLFELEDSGDTQNVWRSLDAGLTWTQLSSWDSTDATDPDFVSGSANAASFGGSPSLCMHNDSFYQVGGVRGSVANIGALSRVWKLATTVSGAMLSLGAVGSGFIDWTQDYARTFVGVKTAGGLWKYTIASGALTAVTDVDYPTTTVRGIVYLNGVFYVMDGDGNVYGSANEDITSWSALNFIAAEFESDGGVALAKYGFYVVAFGEYTTEFFFDAGNATGSPLSPVQNGVLNVGCADADTVTFIDDTILFVGRAKGPSQSITGARFVAQIEGTSYKRLSSPDIDRILLADDFEDVEAIAFSVAGHSFYCLNLGTSALSLVYDMSQQTWTVWNRRRTSFTANPVTVVTASGTATWTGTHSFADGDVGVITGGTGTHTSLNGTYNMTVPASGTLCWRLGGTSYAGTNTATITGTGYSAADLGVVAASGYAGVQLALDASNGKLYQISPSAYQDDSVYMDWEARMTKLDLGTNKAKFAAYADFVSDRASGNVLMRMSDDDSQTWTKYKPKSLAPSRTRFNRGGEFLRRVYNYRITDNIPVRAQRVDYIIDEGAE